MRPRPDIASSSGKRVLRAVGDAHTRDELHDRTASDAKRSAWSDASSEALVSRSLAPPAPLGDPSTCEDHEAVRAQPACAEAPVPAPLTSHPPPGAAHGCYTGTIVDGRYEIGAVLGQGGMGVVYAARHVVIGKRCAMKILRSEMSADPEIADRFLQEAKAASSIGNPHIIDISDFGKFPDGTTYFVMEYLDGQPLSALIKEHGALPADRLVRIALQLAAGLSAAHARGIVHRDLKPDNIMLSTNALQSDFVKILDFGIAKIASRPRVTVAGKLFGTPYYMSPEQASGGDVDQRTDVYALGVILYEMASGRVPFDADTLMGILTQHVYKKPVPPHELSGARELPGGLEAIILKALAKEASQRYQSMQEIARDLALVAAGLPLDAPSPAVVAGALIYGESLPGRGIALPIAVAPVARPRRWGVYVGSAAMLLAAAGALGLVLRGRAITGASAPQAHPTAVEPRSAGTTPAASAQANPAEAPHGSVGTKAAAILDDPPNAAASPPASAGTASSGTPDHRAAPLAIVVAFAADPLDAHVYRGREDLGPTPLTLHVQKSAPLTLDVRAPGYKTARVKVDGSQPRVTVKLVALPRKTRVRKPPAPVNGIVNPWS